MGFRRPATAEELGVSGDRVLGLLRLAMEDGDLPVSDVAVDLILAAASIMMAVHMSTGNDICPPMTGNPNIDRALHAVSELAASMVGKVPENVS